jgi:secreted trypsin-like serine protease
LLKVPLVDFEKCSDAYPTKIISESQICAGGEPGKGVCNGDNGGPLMTLKFGRPPFWMLNGIVSSAPKCNFTLKNSEIVNRPTIYVNVEKYLDWILKNIDQTPKEKNIE